jgi:hypothetical protein
LSPWLKYLCPSKNRNLRCIQSAWHKQKNESRFCLNVRLLVSSCQLLGKILWKEKMATRDILYRNMSCETSGIPLYQCIPRSIYCSTWSHPACHEN